MYANPAVVKLCPLRFLLEDGHDAHASEPRARANGRAAKRDQQRARAMTKQASSAGARAAGARALADAGAAGAGALAGGRPAGAGALAGAGAPASAAPASAALAADAPDPDALSRSLRHACADPRCSGPDVVAALLDAGAEANAANSNGKSPLHFACQLRADPAVAELLLQRGADLNATTHRRRCSSNSRLLELEAAPAHCCSAFRLTPMSCDPGSELDPTFAEGTLRCCTRAAAGTRQSSRCYLQLVPTYGGPNSNRLSSQGTATP